MQAWASAKQCIPRQLEASICLSKNRHAAWITEINKYYLIESKSKTDPDPKELLNFEWIWTYSCTELGENHEYYSTVQTWILKLIQVDFQIVQPL